MLCWEKEFAYRLSVFLQKGLHPLLRNLKHWLALHCSSIWAFHTPVSKCVAWDKASFSDLWELVTREDASGCVVSAWWQTSCPSTGPVLWLLFFGHWWKYAKIPFLLEVCATLPPKDCSAPDLAELRRQSPNCRVRENTQACLVKQAYDPRSSRPPGRRAESFKLA